MATARSASRGRTRGVLLGSAALLLLLPPPSAQAQEVELRWRFQSGADHVYRQVQTSRMGSPMGEVVQTQTAMLRKEVLAVGDDGVAEVRVTHERVHMVAEGPQGRQEFDSEAEAGAADPELAILGAMVGRSFEMSVAPDGSVRGVKGLEEMVEEMLATAMQDAPAAAAEQMRRMFETMFGDEAMEGLMQQGMQTLPAGPVSPGDSWNLELSIPLPFGNAVYAYTYTLRDVVREDGRRVARIELGGSVGDLEPDPDNPMAGMIQFSGGDVSGEVFFDVDRGLLLRSSVSSTMSITAMGQSMDTRSTQEMELVEGR